MIIQNKLNKMFFVDLDDWVYSQTYLCSVYNTVTQRDLGSFFLGDGDDDVWGPGEGGSQGSDFHYNCPCVQIASSPPRQGWCLLCDKKPDWLFTLLSTVLGLFMTVHLLYIPYSDQILSPRFLGGVLIFLSYSFNINSRPGSNSWDQICWIFLDIQATTFWFDSVQIIFLPKIIIIKKKSDKNLSDF